MLKEVKRKGFDPDDLGPVSNPLDDWDAWRLAHGIRKAPNDMYSWREIAKALGKSPFLGSKQPGIEHWSNGKPGKRVKYSLSKEAIQYFYIHGEFPPREKAAELSEWVSAKQIEGALGLTESDLVTAFSRPPLRKNYVFSPPRLLIEDYARYYVAGSGEWGLDVGLYLTPSEAVDFGPIESADRYEMTEFIEERRAVLELDKKHKHHEEWRQECQSVSDRIRAFLRSQQVQRKA